MSSPQKNTNWINKDQKWFQPGKGFLSKSVPRVFPTYDSVTNLGLAIGCNLLLSVQTEPRDPGFGFTRLLPAIGINLDDHPTSKNDSN